MRRNYFDHRTFCGPFIQAEPLPGVAMAVVIPAIAEKDLVLTLESLLQCDPPPCQTEVIVIVNDSDQSDSRIKDLNREVYSHVLSWTRGFQRNGIVFHIHYFTDLPAKKAGVGLARKIGMDEASRRFMILGKNGLILSLDADCLVRKDYLVKIFQYFNDHPETDCVSIRFEHPMDGNKFSKDVYQSVVLYELHLRYYRRAQIFTGLPFAFHTLGSAMAVRSREYVAQGGMNTRKAGEDFYFLHKFTRIGKCSSFTDTVVFPSPRPSDRVPFGTGKAIKKVLKGNEQKTYNLLSFDTLGKWILNIESIPAPPLDSFLVANRWGSVLDEIRSNTVSNLSFRKRFFQWFNAFKLMKYLHHAREECCPDMPVREEAIHLARKVWQKDMSGWSTSSILSWYREKDLAG